MDRIKAEIVADSLSPQGHRLTSLLVTMPRFILAELNTHRMLSKNSASSRAIPFKKMVESVKENPFIPIAWQKDHKGMQGTEYWTDETNEDLPETSIPAKSIMKVKDILSNLWIQQRNEALMQASIMNKIGATKQMCNRLLEPFMYHTVLISGTEWENFFSLRCPQYLYEPENKFFRSRKDFVTYWNENFSENRTVENFFQINSEIEWLLLNKGQAEIHMMATAEAIWDAMNESTPKQLQAGEWHIPFENKIESNALYNAWYREFLKDYTEKQLEEGVAVPTEDWFQQLEICNEVKVKISTAMAARTSFTIVGDEKEFTYESQLKLHDRMAIAVPFHASPFEHCAKCMDEQEYELNIKGTLEWTGGPYDKPLPTEGTEGWCRNFRGFIQYREILENQNKQ